MKNEEKFTASDARAIALKSLESQATRELRNIKGHIKDCAKDGYFSVTVTIRSKPQSFVDRIIKEMESLGYFITTAKVCGNTEMFIGWKSEKE